MRSITISNLAVLTNPNAVIPAKAGIQARRYRYVSRIPACAGVTECYEYA
jgi:hypothetical protein